MKDTPKEVAYDKHIAPLMKEIISHCKRHKINLFATFALDQVSQSDGPLYCTTSIQADAACPSRAHMTKLSGLHDGSLAVMPALVAITITSPPAPSGSE